MLPHSEDCVHITGQDGGLRGVSAATQSLYGAHLFALAAWFGQEVAQTAYLRGVACNRIAR